MKRAKQLRNRIIPPGSRRETTMRVALYGLTILRREGLIYFFKRLYQISSWQTNAIYQSIRYKLNTHGSAKVIRVEEIHVNPQPQPHQVMVDIIICIQDSLVNIQQCLSSVAEYTTPPFTLTLVDNGNDNNTRRYLTNFANEHSCKLLRNDRALAYPLAANLGLKTTSAEFVILLNSNTLVAPGWLDRMVACAQSNPKIGLVGPLSNEGKFQSIAGMYKEEQTDNPLPLNIPAAQMSDWVAKYSKRLYPEMRYLDSYCLMIRHKMIDQIGFINAENTTAGHDEWGNYFLLASKAGWQLALADDTYIFHTQFNSLTQEGLHKREIRQDAFHVQNQAQPSTSETIANYHNNLVLYGIRSHNHQIIERESIIQQGHERHSNRRVLFVSPIRVLSGGANLIILAARAMQQMGVDVQIMNLQVHRAWFQKNYPDLKLPVVFGDIEDVPQIVVNFDAVVATSNPTVSWIVPASAKRPDMAIGYYIQDYEPYFYPPDSHEYRKATASYTLIPNLLRMVTTPWISDQIRLHHGVSCHVVGAHMDVDLFQPRPRTDLSWPDRPLRIAAMIRPTTDRRNPKMTMQILQQASNMYGSKLEFYLFGCKPTDPGFAPLAKDFPWQLAGELHSTQMANLLNESDIFVDYSVFQAFGLTALESMACGLSAVVPSKGGGGIYAKHEKNCLVVDSSDQNVSYSALQRLIEDDTLRPKLQMDAIATAAQFYPEFPALNILNALFSDDK